MLVMTIRKTLITTALHKEVAIYLLTNFNVFSFSIFFWPGLPNFNGMSKCVCLVAVNHKDLINERQLLLVKLFCWMHTFTRAAPRRKCSQDTILQLYRHYAHHSFRQTLDLNIKRFVVDYWPATKKKNTKITHF